MNRLLRFCLSVMFLVLSIVNYTVAQTIVYTNNFTAIPGFPPAGFAIAGGSTDVTPGSSASVQVGGPVGSVVLTTNELAAWVSAASFPVGIINNGYSHATAALASYAAPFNPTLSLNPFTVRWTFNMRTASLPTGIGSGTDNAVVVLACTDPNVHNAGNGYAVAYNNGVPGSLRLIRYTGGLWGTVTTLATSSPVLAAPTNYASVRVTYNPLTNFWSLFVRDDGATTFADPAIGGLVLEGTATDATYTAVAMTHFGFYANYSVRYVGLGPDVLNAYFDNYTVSTQCPDIEGDLNICRGSTGLLTHPIPGGVWTSLNPSVVTINPVTGAITGLLVDTCTIIYTSSTCTAVGVVNVISIAGPGPITGILSRCEGDTTTLYSTTTSPASSWSSSNTAIATIGALTGLVTGVSAGTTTITYQNLPGCRSTAIVTINPQPGPILGTLSLCTGNNTTLLNASAGGAWASSTPLVASVVSGTGVVSALTAGTSTISYTLPEGCFSTATATVNTSPSAITTTAAFTVCVGNTVPLSCAPAGGVWSFIGAGVISMDVFGVVTGLSAGTATVSYTVASGCRSTVVVTVVGAVAAITGTATVCEGRTTLLSSTSTGGTWSSSNIAVAIIDAAGLATGIATGTATITYSLGVGCTATRTITVNTSPAAVTGVPVVCAGQSTALSTVTPGGTWASSNITIATVDVSTGVVTGNVAGTATISYIIPNGCFSTAVVTVNPIPTTPSGTATVCQGSTTTLTSTPAGGAWSSSDNTIATVAAGVVTGVTLGTATITYTVSGCINTRTVTVLATPNSIGGTPAVCVGLTATLTNTTPGGTWSSSNATVASIVGATGVVTGNVAGVVNISYTIGNGCFRTRSFTVNPLPAAIGGPSSVCPVSTITLTNTSGGGTWVSSNTAIATVVSGTGAVTGVASGTTTITYTLATGCIATRVVTVITAPVSTITPIGDTVLCPGDFVTLTGSTTAGAAYQWFVGGVPITGTTTPTYIASTSGSYQVRVSIATGCATLSTPMSVTVAPATATITVPGGTTSTCAGTPIVLNANTGTGLTYQWELGGVPIAAATGSSYSALTAGSYAVRVINAAGCWAVSTPVSIIVNTSPSNVITVSGPLTFCAGNTLNISAVPAAGNTYQWYSTAGSIAGATNVTYAATTTGDYYVEITNATGCTIASAISSVVVNPLPDVTITPGGPLVFCSGSGVSLNAVPGFSYQWYRNGVALAGANSVSYAATSSGGYRVRVVNAATGCAATTLADTIVTVIIAPNAIALTPARFCWGGSALLSTSVSGLGSALGYQWLFNGTPIPGATAPSYSAGASGSYICDINVPGSCSVLTTAVAVTEVPLPDPPVAFNGTVMYTSGMYVTYQWYKNLIAIPGATAATTPATGNGNYKVAVTDTNGCQAVSATYVLSGWTGPTNVANINSTDINIYPNPASGKVYITSTQPVRAILSSIDGRMLLDVPAADVLDLSTLADGVYMIAVYDQQNTMLKNQRLIKTAQ